MDARAGVSHYHLRRRRQARIRRIRRLALLTAVLFAVGAVVFGFAYAGSSDRVAEGVTVDGVDVGGLTTSEAVRRLQQRYIEIAAKPVVVHVGKRRFKVSAAELGVVPDWRAALAEARSRGDGFAFVRGFRRLYVRFFGVAVDAPATANDRALNAFVNHLAKAVNVPHRDAAIRLRGLDVALVRGASGSILDRKEAAKRVLAGLASFDRAPVWLPVRPDRPAVTSKSLRPALRQARIALSAPVRLSFGPTYYRLPRWRLARMLTVGEAGELKVAGAGADAFFARFEKVVNRPAKDASFAVDGSTVRVVPSEDARLLDVPLTARHILSAAFKRTNRDAKIVVVSKPAEVTTREANAMGIDGVVGSYTTEYGGVPNRIHNVQLVAHLIDDHLIAPGATFSFNETTGARTPEKGFEVAPVIINGELQNALGGGVCQVSTTVFNAAYDAGLEITARTNHALYISHYPQGRDATVDYPDIDLRFVNDTGHWLLLRSFVGSYSLTVNLYGTPTHRRVESETAPLVTTGGPPVKRVADPGLYVGQEVVDDPGSPSLSTSVHRKVYTASGKLLYDNTWYSSYRGETKLVRYGTKPKPKPQPKPKPPASTTPATTTPAATTPASTTPAQTTPAQTTPAQTTPASTAPVVPVAPPAGGVEGAYTESSSGSAQPGR